MVFFSIFKKLLSDIERGADLGGSRPGFLRQTRRRPTLCSVCSLKRIPRKRILYIRSPFHLLLFKSNIHNRTGLKGPPSNYFRRCDFFRNFSQLQRAPFDFIEVPLGLSRVKCYIRTFDVKSALYCILQRRSWRRRRRAETEGRGSKTGVFMETSYV